MTYKYTTVRIQRKEALLGYIVPKGALFIRGNGLQFICIERPKDPFDISASFIIEDSNGNILLEREPKI
mgnify:CR=1 FL=1